MHTQPYTETVSQEQDCQLTVRLYGQNVIMFVVQGYLNLATAKAMIEHAERLLAQHPKVHALHDWEAVSGYDNASRLELTKFLAFNSNRFQSANLLLHSKVVEFGVEVANIVLNHKINVHNQRDSFERAVARVVELAVS